MLVLWTISFGFRFPDNCNRETLHDLLQRCAQDWPGWEKFPWRVTRGIHRFIDDPPVNFHYLLLQTCITAFACNVVLRAKHVSLDDMLDMMIRERFEFVGVLRQLLINSLQVLRDSEGKTYIPDCTSIEEGHLGVSAKELDRRRKVFRAAVERAAREFVRILNYASQAGNMEASVAGHSLKAWARGVELPTQKELMVRIEQVDGQTVISPRPEEACEFVRAGKTIPKLVVQGLRAQSMARVVEAEKQVGGGRCGVGGAKPGDRSQESGDRSRTEGHCGASAKDRMEDKRDGGERAVVGSGTVNSDQSSVNSHRAVEQNRMETTAAKVHKEHKRSGSERAAANSEQNGLEKAGAKEPGMSQRFRPLSDDWRAVQWNGTTINLREREKVKDFLRMLWNKGAKRRTRAIAAGARFPKPSSLFVAGERYIREAASGAGRDIAVPSESGAMIRLVYRDAVGKVVAGKRGAGPTKYYLRVFADSDNT